MEKGFLSLTNDERRKSVQIHPHPNRQTTTTKTGSAGRTVLNRRTLARSTKVIRWTSLKAGFLTGSPKVGFFSSGTHLNLFPKVNYLGWPYRDPDSLYKLRSLSCCHKICMLFCFFTPLFASLPAWEMALAVWFPNKPLFLPMNGFVWSFFCTLLIIDMRCTNVSPCKRIFNIHIEVLSPELGLGPCTNHDASCQLQASHSVFWTH